MSNDASYFQGKHYAFNQNTKCEYFPCHTGVQEEDFNCLFCYCPLYALGEKCGGNFKYIADIVKDCSDCTVPHQRKNYGYIVGKYDDIIEMMKKNRE